ncbi:MAG: hypothetical protein NXI10_14555 [bacterium]|nr:hypothetical protein [bacterium]
MKLLQKLLATEFVWIISAALLSFPLGLVGLALVDILIEKNGYDEFVTRIDDQVVLLYLLMVIVSFIGILLMRFIRSSVRVLLRKEDENEDEDE